MINRVETIGCVESNLLAQQVLQSLQYEGLDPTRATIIESAPPPGEHVVGYYNLPERVLCWSRRGALWGCAWGLAISVWLYWVPEIAPLLVIIPVLLGAVTLGLLGAVTAGLYSMRIPRNSVLQYAAGAQEGRYVVLYEGSTLQIQRARQVIACAKSLASVLNMPVNINDSNRYQPH